MADSAFRRALALHGPDADFPVPTLAQARHYCRRFARSHAENFAVASLFLPRRLVPHFHVVYAYCRWADDLGDESASAAEALRLLRWWRNELNACFAGTPRHPITVALRATADEFAIPKQPFADLLFAFEQDQLVKNYESFDQLLGYCRHSANPVGRIVLNLFAAATPANIARSDAICTALQLANFWQDVGRDLDLGRVYLPEIDRRAFRYSEDDLLARRCTPAFRALMQYEVERTRDLFYRGLPLREQLPGRLGAEIDLIVAGGLAVLRRIERQGYDVWVRRPKVTKLDAAGLLLGTGARHLRRLWRGYRW